MKRTGRKLKLTPEVEQQMLDTIRAGAFDWVAAQAVGINPATFYRWMELGDSPKGRKVFRVFREKVMVARAQARAVAEALIRRDDPLKWVRLGPGRAYEGRPGWTDVADAHDDGEAPALEVIIRHVDRSGPAALPPPKEVVDVEFDVQPSEGEANGHVQPSPRVAGNGQKEGA